MGCVMLLSDFVIYIIFIVQFAGTERCCEALQKLKRNYDIVVNIQGDEPLIEPEIIDGVVQALQVLELFTMELLVELRFLTFWSNQTIWYYSILVLI